MFLIQFVAIKCANGPKFRHNFTCSRAIFFKDSETVDLLSFEQTC